jgi:hypothetical protein
MCMVEMGTLPQESAQSGSLGSLPVPHTTLHVGPHQADTSLTPPPRSFLAEPQATRPAYGILRHLDG